MFGSVDHPELSYSNKRYLMGIAGIYSVRQMRGLKQEQYRELLINQYKLGKENMVLLHTKGATGSKRQATKGLNLML